MSDIRKVIIDGEEFEVELEQDGETWIATVEGKSFNIVVPNSTPTTKQRKTGSGKAKKTGIISANIPGKVVTIEVKQGDEVAEGQVILILEAMKMQNEIQAEVSGIVTEINCKEGESIEANVPLVVIAPDEE
jgi:biotin carboxyl carrier protein